MKNIKKIQNLVQDLDSFNNDEKKIKILKIKFISVSVILSTLIINYIAISNYYSAATLFSVQLILLMTYACFNNFNKKRNEEKIKRYGTNKKGETLNKSIKRIKIEIFESISDTELTNILDKKTKIEFKNDEYKNSFYNIIEEEKKTRTQKP